MRAAEPLDRSLSGASAPQSPPATGSAAGEPSYVPAAAPGEAGAAALRSGTVPTAERRAGPLSQQVENPQAAGTRAHGKVFFTIPGEGNFVCSGTAVNSKNRSLVWTAGHCVYDAGEESEGFTNQFVTNFNFVPAYEDGEAPFGEWAAKRLATTDGWRRNANLHFDLGAAVVRKLGGRKLQSRVGARGIGFYQPRDRLLRAIGYPAAAPFDGEREYRCTGRPDATDDPGGRGPRTNRIDCDMTGGSSGGGWVVGTTVVSVTSYGYTTDPLHLYGPQMRGVAERLYKRVRRIKRA